MTLKISTRIVDGITIIDCSGRIVFGDEAAALRDAVKIALERSPNLVLNLAGVNYVDSGGLGTLVGLFTSARNAGGTMKLAALNSRVIGLLQVTKLVTVFELFNNEQLAAQSFAKAAAAKG